MSPANIADTVFVFVMSAFAAATMILAWRFLRMELTMRTLRDVIVGKVNAKAFNALDKDGKRAVIERALTIAIAAVNRVSDVARECDLTVELTPMAKGRKDGQSVEYNLAGGVLSDSDCLCQRCTMRRMMERAGLDVANVDFENAPNDGHRSLH